MALSRQVIISDGTTTEYPITFADGYLSRDEVSVYEEFDDGTPNADIAFIFINDYLIELSRVPVAGNKIVIERDVEANARKVNFIPQYIKSSDLNTMYKHLLYLIQTVLDGRFEQTIIKDLDMGYNRIYNLGAPKQPNDAVRLVDIKTYTDLAENLNNQNAAHEAAAKQSETNSKQSENNSKIWAEGTDSEVQGLGGVHSSKVWSEKAQAVVDGKQDIANLSQTLDDSTTKYPSNNAVKTAIDAKDSLPPQAGNVGKFLTTDGTTASWGDVYSAGNIGDIKYTSRTDVPNGGAWCDGALYTKAQFPDVYQMLIDGKIQSTTVTDFDSSVSANGSCGFFGLDTANECFKVPMLKDVYIKAGQTPIAFGAETLPNITGAYAHSTNAETRDFPDSAVGAFFVNANETGMKNSSKMNDTGAVMRFSASRSSSTYQDGAKVNPDHVVYRAYIVLYASAAEASVAQAAEFMTALDGKANADMSNVSTAGKSTAVGWGMPDYSAGVSYSSNFVAPTNGYCLATTYIGAWGVAKLLADGNVIDQQHNPTSGTRILIYTRGFCKKGQTISKDEVSDWGNIIFYPCIGG